MSKKIDISKLGDAIQQELTMYGEEVVEAIDAAGEAAMKKLVKQTKANAPVSDRAGSGDFKRHITSTRIKGQNGDTFIWHVKAPDYRLTHLLVHGHATVTGGRTKANPFLENALNTVLPEYERAVEEALKK